MSGHDLLLEIGTEELPSRQLNSLSEQLTTQVQAQLKKANIAHGQTHSYATPRRLAVVIHDVALTQQSQQIEKRGPALKAAFDAEGHPTLACLGFANACNTTVDQLIIEETEKGGWLFFRQDQSGKPTDTLLPTLIKQAIQQLAIPKPMRWGDHSTAFIRPVHWVVLLWGKELIPTEILGQATIHHTYGHRFLHPQKIRIPQARDYAELLKEQGQVIADFAQRRQLIATQLQQAVAGHGQILEDEALLDEVTGLVEWPVALLGEFAASFLELPAEAVSTTLKHHQKCFSVVDKKGQLLPYFVTISNIKSKNPARVIAGNERVVQARLSDAQFFYHSDLKHRLEALLPALQQVVFHQKLGTLFEKSQRVATLAAYLAAEMHADIAICQRAGLLAKTDLMTSMVGEFPELQGIMGYYYALRDNEGKEVAQAIREHYQPRFSGDELPTTLAGCLVAIADKMDTLTGLFAIKQPPTGEKDPFGLRRAGLGILRICIDKQLPIDLWQLITKAAAGYPLAAKNQAVIHDVFHFLIERLRVWYADRGVDADVFAAVFARSPTQLLDFHHRILAIQQFQTLPVARTLAAAQKRVANILKNVPVEQHHPVNPTLLTDPAEQALLSAMERQASLAEPLYQQGKYTEVLTVLASLQTPIDHFFDKVMVMVEEKSVRNNRLALLYALQQLFLQVADLSLLSPVLMDNGEVVHS